MATESDLSAAVEALSAAVEDVDLDALSAERQDALVDLLSDTAVAVAAIAPVVEGPHAGADLPAEAPAPKRKRKVSPRTRSGPVTSS
jgi:hypothetical protein